MLRILNIFLIAAISMLLLTGCKPAKDHDYFLTHPHQLAAEYNYCIMLSGPEAYADPECVAAINAAHFVNQIQTNPFVFGNNIMTAQMQLASSQQAIVNLQKEVKELQRSNTATGSTIIQNKQDQIAQLNQSIGNIQKTITTYYAALSLVFSRPN